MFEVYEKREEKEITWEEDRNYIERLPQIKLCFRIKLSFQIVIKYYQC